MDRWNWDTGITDNGVPFALGYQEWVPDFDELHARNTQTAEEREEMLTGLLTDPDAKKGYCSYQIGDIQADIVRNESTGWDAWINGQTAAEGAERGQQETETQSGPPVSFE